MQVGHGALEGVTASHFADTLFLLYFGRFKS